MTEHYPKPGDKLTVTYVDEGYYADSRTGEPVTDVTPEEYIQYHIEKSHDVEYTVCALVTVPYQISFRASLMYGMDAIMGTEQLKADSGAKLYSLSLHVRYAKPGSRGSGGTLSGRADKGGDVPFDV